MTFSDTGETCVLETKPGSACHFFKLFTIGEDDIQLRLDWSDLDKNEQPKLDADFRNKNTGKHRSLKGKRQCAHHTESSPGKGRCYEWVFDGYSSRFSVEVVWLAPVSEGLYFDELCSAEVISALNRELDNG